MSVDSNLMVFSFLNNNYSLSLEYASGTAPRTVTLVLYKEEEGDGDNSNFDYDFTKSLAPFILLIIGLLWILLNALLFYFFKGFERYCKTEHFDRNSKFSTFWAMLLTGHPFGTVYTYKSPTTSKLERSVIYFGRAVGLMLFVNIYHMEKLDTERFLEETESGSKWDIFFLPYLTVLPIVWFIAVLIRGKCS